MPGEVGAQQGTLIEAAAELTPPVQRYAGEQWSWSGNLLRQQPGEVPGQPGFLLVFQLVDIAGQRKLIIADTIQPLPWRWAGHTLTTERGLSQGGQTAALTPWGGLEIVKTVRAPERRV